ncbi:MAG: hypothetical protein WC979_03500 [Candidatus Pacearchaeota archaeon]|jgi:hypothetical protein
MRAKLGKQYTVIGKFYKERHSENQSEEDRREAYLALKKVHTAYSTSAKTVLLRERHAEKALKYGKKARVLELNLDRQNFGEIAAKDLGGLEPFVIGYEQNGPNTLNTRDEVQLWLDYYLARQKVTMADMNTLKMAMAETTDALERRRYENRISDYESHLQLMKGLVRHLEKGRVCKVISTH